MVLYHQSLTLCLPKRMHCNRLWRNCLILIKIVDSILKSFCFLSLFLTLSCVFVLLVVYCFVGVFCCLAYLFASCDPTFVDQGVSCKVVILSYRQTPVCILYLCSENRIFYTCVSAIVIPRFSSSQAFLLLSVDCGMSLYRYHTAYKFYILIHGHIFLPNSDATVKLYKAHLTP